MTYCVSSFSYPCLFVSCNQRLLYEAQTSEDAAVPYILNLNVSEWNIIEAADGELSLDPELVDL